METFLQSYIGTALWSSLDDDDEPFDNNYSIEDLAPETIAKMKADCDKFCAENAADIADNEALAGHDFWLTRNRHGAGFWDGDWPEAGERLTAASYKFGEVNLYVGDDGLIYL
jgi:hypothetical protein